MDIQLHSILSTTVSDLHTEANSKSEEYLWAFHIFRTFPLNHPVVSTARLQSKSGKKTRKTAKSSEVNLSSPAEHQFGVFALHVFVHQLQQKRSHDVSVVLQLPVQRHRQEGGEITPSTSVEVRTALQRADELEDKERRF